jgi:hypothetical protein
MTDNLLGFLTSVIDETDDPSLFRPLNSSEKMRLTLFYQLGRDIYQLLDNSKHICYRGLNGCDNRLFDPLDINFKLNTMIKENMKPFKKRDDYFCNALPDITLIRCPKTPYQSEDAMIIDLFITLLRINAYMIQLDKLIISLEMPHSTPIELIIKPINIFAKKYEYLLDDISSILNILNNKH